MSVSSVGVQTAGANLMIMTVLNALPRLLLGVNAGTAGTDSAEFSAAAASQPQPDEVRALQTAFQTGDLSAARRAFASIRQSLQTPDRADSPGSDHARGNLIDTFVRALSYH